MAKKNKKSSAGVLARAIFVLIAIVVVVSGVTFAALQSQAATLTGNVIQTATATLQVSRDDVTYKDSVDGHVFGAIIPGGQAVPSNGFTVYVKNTGTTKMTLRLSIPSQLANPNNVDLSKVHVLITPAFGGAEQRITLSELVSSNTTGGVPLANFKNVFSSNREAINIKVAMDADAYTGPGAKIDNFSLNFIGVAGN